MTDLTTILSIVEIWINGSQMLDYWLLEEYFEAGYAIGMTSGGMIVLVGDIVEEYITLTEWLPNTNYFIKTLNHWKIGTLNLILYIFIVFSVNQILL